jgi:hypothetical protein
MSAGRRLRWVGYLRPFLGKLVATVLSRAYNHPLKSRPRAQAASIWERSDYGRAAIDLSKVFRWESMMLAFMWGARSCVSSCECLQSCHH